MCRALIELYLIMAYPQRKTTLTVGIGKRSRVSWTDLTINMVIEQNEATSKEDNTKVQRSIFLSPDSTGGRHTTATAGYKTIISVKSM
jgi:hypothetical protein